MFIGEFHRQILAHELPFCRQTKDRGNRCLPRSIAAPDLLAVLRKIESRGAHEKAQRCREYAGRVFRYAIATGRAERDPSGDLRGALTPVKVKHHASITDPKAIGALLRSIRGFSGSYITKCALQLAPWFLCAPANYVKQNGKKSTLISKNGAYPAIR